MSPAAQRTLNLIQSNPSYMTARGYDVFNHGIREVLAIGAATYAPRRRIGYSLTELGRELLAEIASHHSGV